MAKKSEVRNPKSEGNPKTEDNGSRVEGREPKAEGSDHPDRNFSGSDAPSLRISDFGFRTSFYWFVVAVSGFGGSRFNNNHKSRCFPFALSGT